VPCAGRRRRKQRFHLSRDRRFLPVTRQHLCPFLISAIRTVPRAALVCSDGGLYGGAILLSTPQNDKIDIFQNCRFCRTFGAASVPPSQRPRIVVADATPLRLKRGNQTLSAATQEAANRLRTTPGDAQGHRSESIDGSASKDIKRHVNADVRFHAFLPRGRADRAGPRARPPIVAYPLHSGETRGENQVSPHCPLIRGGPSRS
jgi:hypothetical protein